MSLLQRLRTILTRGSDELYIDPLQGTASFDEEWAQAKLEDKQRTLSKKMRAEGKSILTPRKYAPSFFVSPNILTLRE